MGQLRVNPDLPNARPNARHRLPIVGVEALLDPAKLEASAAPCIRRKRSEVAPRAPEPQEWLIRHDSLCKFLYILSTRRRPESCDAHAEPRCCPEDRETEVR